MDGPESRLLLSTARSCVEPPRCWAHIEDPDVYRIGTSSDATPFVTCLHQEGGKEVDYTNHVTRGPEVLPTRSPLGST
jgi:hypothetical protein